MTFRRTALTFVFASLIAAAGCSPTSGLDSMVDDSPASFTPANEGGAAANEAPSFAASPELPVSTSVTVNRRPLHAPVKGIDPGDVTPPVGVVIDAGPIVTEVPVEEAPADRPDEQRCIASDNVDLEDTDGDGVTDLCDRDDDDDTILDDADECAGTETSDAAYGLPAIKLAPERFAIVNEGDVEFTVGRGPGDEEENKGSDISFKDTRGCSCAQIVEALVLEREEAEDHRMYGCSSDTMRDWMKLMEG